jgi:DNA-binding XRE family transcriptional regulator
MNALPIKWVDLNCKVLRTSLGYHQMEFALILEISEQELSLIESGQLVPEAATGMKLLKIREDFRAYLPVVEIALDEGLRKHN